MKDSTFKNLNYSPKRIMLFAFFFLIFFQFSELSATCNWKARNGNLFAYDSCYGTVYKIMTGIRFNNKYSAQYKYEFTLNNTSVGQNGLIQQLIVTQNGTYTICVKVTDTINNCDTTYCKTITVDCIKNCNWKSKFSSFGTYDSCKEINKRGYYGYLGIFGYISFNSSTSCYKFKWTINNTVNNNSANYGNSNYSGFKVNQNGNYTICVKVTDTCNKCDTTFCQTISISCIPSQCNWKAKFNQIRTWDSCKGYYGKTNSISGVISFNNTSNVGCFKYEWTINNSPVASSSAYFIIPLYQNGTYNICVKVTDTCNKCDTTFCATRTITCFKNCNWKKRIIGLSVYDSCPKNYIAGHLSYSNALNVKFEWTVNGQIVSSSFNSMSNLVTQNGTYTICVKLTDTVNNCDTSLCKTRVITCIKTCNWKALNASFTVGDSCKKFFGNKNSLYAYIYFPNTNTSCFKYSMYINNSLVTPNSFRKWTNDAFFIYQITQNGTYNICVKVTDTCNKCDTTFCSTRTISCFPSKCNWKARLNQFRTWDSCSGYLGKTNSIGGIIFFKNNSNVGCYKYEWTINNSPVASSLNYFQIPLYQNGTYNICVKVTDTCNKCDTTFCVTRVINCCCVCPKCNWSARKIQLRTFDSCSYIGGYMTQNSNYSNCFKYEWSINSVPVAGNTYQTSKTINANGNYTICVKVIDTCNKCDTMYCKTVVVKCNKLSTKFIENNHNLGNVYPNPANNLLNLNLFSAQQAKYEILNSLGQKVLDGSLIHNNNEINVAILANGIYSIKIMAENKIQMIKFIVSR